MTGSGEEPEELAEITQLLHAAGAGDASAMDELYASVYPRLRRIAGARLRGQRRDATLGTTALVHEAYMKVAGKPGSDYADRGHFFALAARAMRQVILNHAEKRHAAKRGGDAIAVTLGDTPVQPDADAEIIALDAALSRLSAMSERQGHVVECIFFAGLTVEETAEALDISTATVKRDWATARAWLYRELRDA